jgi:hypothetical protein
VIGAVVYYDWGERVTDFVEAFRILISYAKWSRLGRIPCGMAMPYRELQDMQLGWA